MAARNANRGRSSGREAPGNRPSGGGGRPASAGASASSARGGAGGGAAARGATPAHEATPPRAARGADELRTPGGGRAAAGGSSAPRPPGSAPRAADVEAGLFGDATPKGAGRTSERERELASVRETGDVPERASMARAGGSDVSTRVAGRGQPSPGLSAWLVGAENPFAMMRRVEEDLDRVFRVFGIPRLGAALAPSRELEELLTRAPSLSRAAQWSPQLEVFEREGKLVVHADLPGVKRDDVEVNVEGDVLTIRGERRQEQRETEGGYRRTERSYGTFFRQIALPEGVEPNQVQASFNDGVLEVVVPSPRPEQQRRRRIEIR